MSDHARIAYFSMEIGVDPLVPTYSGGLGMLAGDLIRSAADIALPLVGISLLHRKGYFQQSIDSSGMQQEAPVAWDPADKLELMKPRVAMKLNGRKVAIQAWKYTVKPTHAGGKDVPVYFLDTDIPDNDPHDRHLTDQLYGGDHRHRLEQEAVLGIGGIYMLRALGHRELKKYHMNEGHGAFVTIELLAEHSFKRKTSPADPEVIQAVRDACVFTTHTPVPAGHDQFSLQQVFEALGEQSAIYDGAPYCPGGMLNMTRLAMHYSHFSNAVARRHAEVSRDMFHGHRIDYVTNGVHAPTWLSPEMQALLDKHAPNWRADFRAVRRAMFIPDADVFAAHAAGKKRLLDHVNQHCGLSGAAALAPDRFTIGFARRATGYKRADLLLTDVEAIKHIASKVGPIQVIYAGKAHPRDGQGKDIIKHIIEKLAKLAPHVRGVFVPNYDFALCQKMICGVDLWLNNPIPPLEASGTSGMKAAMNGVPSLSTPDGWWLEGCAEGLTGWTIGRDDFEANTFAHDPGRAGRDAVSLYSKLEQEILPLYYKDRPMWAHVMRSSIAMNGSQFNTNRAMEEYAKVAYGL
jgi:starch phosphorylase